MGQSSGWLVSRNSSTPRRASAASGLSVRTPMFSATVFAQEMMGRGIHWMGWKPCSS